ncbi:MAG: murein L,D-transpeptidase family protein [Candidatus Sericytochromatia bacterium]
MLNSKSEEPRAAAAALHQPPAAGLLNAQKPLTGLLPVPFDKTKISLLVEKAQYRLTVYYARKAIKSYAVVLGPDPVSDKRREGDGATPEGVFHIRNLYPHDRWSKFMWIDYPTAESYEKHRQAKAAGRIPPDATIGGEVGIHGVPGGDNGIIDRRENWTAGCISLKNHDIDELYSVSSQGMQVEILP